MPNRHPISLVMQNMKIKTALGAQDIHIHRAQERHSLTRLHVCENVKWNRYEKHLPVFKKKKTKHTTSTHPMIPLPAHAYRKLYTILKTAFLAITKLETI